MVSVMSVLRLILLGILALLMIGSGACTASNLFFALSSLWNKFGPDGSTAFLLLLLAAVMGLITWGLWRAVRTLWRRYRQVAASPP